MASTGVDLRMVLGHRAIAKRKTNTVLPAFPEDPHSPPGSANIALDEEATPPLLRSSLNADTTFLERLAAEDVEEEDIDGSIGASERSQEGEEPQEPPAQQHQAQQAPEPLACARVSSTGSCSSLLAGCGGMLLPGEPTLPSFLHQQGEGEKEGASCGGSGALRGELGGWAASESPSPSQRAALDALDSADGGQGVSSGLRVEEEEADEDAEAVEAEAAVCVIDHLIADRLISERPELRRYDSADAALEGAKRKQRLKKAEALASRLQAEVHTGSGGSDDEGAETNGSGSGLPDNALQRPPRTHSNRRGSEGYIELAVVPPPPQQPGEAEEETLGLPRPLLAHFDSGDYFKEKAERAGQAPAGAGVVGKPDSARGGQEGGHKAAASFFLHRGGR